MIGPPTLFLGMMEVSDFRSRVGSLRVVSCGATGVTPEFIDAARSGFGATVKRTYGSTEAPTVTTSTWEDSPDRARNTDGHSVGDAVISVVQPGTVRPLPAGERGEVLVRGPELFVGYGEDSQTRDAVRRGWFATGDLGTLDTEGWLTIVGRLKELIIRGGENIASAEVERVLELHPDIRQAVVVGCPDPRLGERVVAFVVGGPPDRRRRVQTVVQRRRCGTIQDPRVGGAPGGDPPTRCGEAGSTGTPGQGGRAGGGVRGP